eukprot:scaffold318_cov110-Cylindrotheca_fusiformis.AAC.3
MEETPPLIHEEESGASENTREIVIVGGGFAGLTCARQLLKSKNDGGASSQFKVTILEASDDIGGRVKGNFDFLPDGHVLDLGAEFIHGQGHALWDLIDEFYGPLSIDHQEGTAMTANHEKFEPYYLLSHADGGPADDPTEEGKYGMYYIDNELIMYNDKRVDELNQQLEAIFKKLKYDSLDSLADALAQQSPPLSKSLLQLAVASYGNTAGCSALSQLSISQLSRFENHWKTNEQEGDFRPPSTIGMFGIAQACLQSLEEHANFELVRSCEVQTVCEAEDGVLVTVKGEPDRHPAAVVVTVPPPILPKIIPNLPESKKEALGMIGFERAIKIVVRFRERLWPRTVQSIIAADDEMIPEIWFREFVDSEQQGITHYIAIGFLVSEAADRLVELLAAGTRQEEKTKNERAGELLMQQLVKMLNARPKTSQTLKADPSLIVATTTFDWKDDAIHVGGGYVYPRIGVCPRHFSALAAPIGNTIFFAGEATNTNACCTVQAAIETGKRAAAEVKACF